MLNDAIKSGTVHAAWNTGRGYSENNQRISAQLLPDGRVAFCDIDRYLDGVMHRPFQGEIVGDDVNPVKLAKFVMQEYDEGRYNSGFYELEKNGGSFEFANALMASMKGAAKSIGRDGKVVANDLVPSTSMSLALNELRGYPQDMQVSEIYDSDDNFSSTLNNLFPGKFEYPDFSHLTVAQVIKRGLRELDASGLPKVPETVVNSKYADSIIGDRSAKYDGLEIHGVRDMNGPDDEDGTHVEPNYDDPQFYSVYAHSKDDGGIECVGDFMTHELAIDYAGELSKQYGWLVGDFSKVGQLKELNLTKSSLDAESIAMEKGVFDYADLKKDQLLSGKVLDLTAEHVVLSLGRSATIIAQSDLSRVPAKGEDVTISVKDGKGVVDDSMDKGVDKGR